MQSALYGMNWNETIFLWFSLFVYCTHSRDSYVYEDNTHTHTPHVWWQKPPQNIATYDTMTWVFWSPISGMHFKQRPKISWIRLFNIWKSKSFETWNVSRFHDSPPPRPLVTIVPNICRYKMALEGLESLVGHGVAGPQEAKGTGGCKTVDAGSSKMMRLQLSKPLFWELRMYQNVISCTRDDDVS